MKIDLYKKEKQESYIYEFVLKQYLFLTSSLHATQIQTPTFGNQLLNYCVLGPKCHL